MTGGDPQDIRDGAGTFDGYALPHEHYRAKRSRGPKYFVTLGVWVLALVMAMLVLTLIDTQVANVPTRYICPPDCGSPPTGLPVATNPRYTAPDGSFSVSYPAAGASYDITTDAVGVTAEWTAGDGGTMRLFSQPAQGRNARQVVEQFVQGAFPNTVSAYELPNATVGYHLGYGVVGDFQPLGSANRADATRVIVIAAIKNDLALVAAAAGPFREFAPGVGPGPPSPANLQIAQDMGKYVNSFTWRGDPPR